MKHAFSLIELSIVLVILGLLTGGILTGQNLIRAAELRSVTTEFQAYQTAVNTFRDKYFALPGDMRNATAFWGEMTNCDAAGTTGVGAQTCDGNGNGNLSFAAAASQNGESYTFWQQLANAGLIEGRYTGIAGTGGTSHSIFGGNIPRSKVGNGGWDAATLSNWPGSANGFAVDYGNLLSIGAQRPNEGPYDPLLTPEEAWNIDTKMDDGKPAYGSIIASHWNNLCSVADDGTPAFNDLEASYNLVDTAARCTLYFRHAF